MLLAWRCFDRIQVLETFLWLMNVLDVGEEGWVNVGQATSSQSEMVDNHGWSVREKVLLHHCPYVVCVSRQIAQTNKTMVPLVVMNRFLLRHRRGFFLKIDEGKLLRWFKSVKTCTLHSSLIASTPKEPALTLAIN